MTRLRTWFGCWVVFSICFWTYTAYEFSLQRDTLAVKNKLLRLAIWNQRWEVDRAYSRNRELDAMRWYWQQTKLWHENWSVIVEKIYFYSNQYGVRPEFSMSIAHRESYFVPGAQSIVNDKPLAWGIMQINLEIWKDELKLNETNVLDLDTNIRCGVWILSQYLKDCDGNEESAANKYWSGSVIPPHSGYVERLKSSKFYRRQQ